MTSRSAPQGARPGLSNPRPSPRESIVVANPNRYRQVSTPELVELLDRAMAELAVDPSATLAVRLVSDREMTRLNRDFRAKAGPTDVLSWPGQDSAEGPHCGDIAISVPAARRQAAERGHDVERELKVLLLHGLLHCVGFDHEHDDGAMERLERRLRRRLIADA